MKRGLVHVLLIIVLMTGAVAAAGQTTKGSGTLTCRRWTFVRHDQVAIGYEQWAWGFCRVRGSGAGLG
jgi:hypothetical protein